jgi:hypothetical protein
MKSLLCTAFLMALIAILSAGCARDATPSPETINTAIAATQQADARAQATLQAAIRTALPATATPAPTTAAPVSAAAIASAPATPTKPAPSTPAPAPTAAPVAPPATPTPGPTPAYATLTEEQLAALIDAAVAEAIAASDDAASAVYTTAADDTITAEEATVVYNYYTYADYYVESAEELLATYYDLYDELASEMLDELSAIEEELAQLNTTLASIDESLQEISAALEQGLAISEEMITQLENAALSTQANADELKAQAQDMMAVMQLDQQNRLNEIAQIQPNNVPNDRVSALQSAFSFVDATNLALADDKLSQVELHNLAQLGKNAQAGLPQLGRGTTGAASTQLAGKFDEVSQQLARGQISQGRSNLGQIERSLGQRPEAPALGQQPAKPDIRSGNVPAPAGGGNRGSRPSRP